MLDEGMESGEAVCREDELEEAGLELTACCRVMIEDQLGGGPERGEQRIFRSILDKRQAKGAAVDVNKS